MKIIFFGTPSFAIPSLESILNSKHELVKVITNPDKKSGRGLKKISTPIKKFCEEKSVPCISYNNFNDKEVYENLKCLNVDLFVVVAFKLLPGKIINIPKYGSINLHPSLLPKYRGSSPIQLAILNGDKETGVTIFKLNEKIDSGHIINQKVYPLDEKIIFSDLYLQLSKQGSNLLLESIDLIDSRKVKYIPQNSSKKINGNNLSYAKKININDCLIDWSLSAEKINNKIRAFSKKPGAFTFLNKKKIKILESNIYKETSIFLKESEAIAFQKKLLVGTKGFPIQINLLQVEGKKEVRGEDFINSNFFINNKIINFG